MSEEVDRPEEYRCEHLDKRWWKQTQERSPLKRGLDLEVNHRVRATCFIRILMFLHDGKVSDTRVVLVLVKKRSGFQGEFDPGRYQLFPMKSPSRGAQRHTERRSPNHYYPLQPWGIQIGYGVVLGNGWRGVEPFVKP